MNIKNINMNTQEILELLDRYYRGETSDEEEQILREYLNSDSISPELEADRDIFRYYGSAEKIPAPSPDLERRIIEAADRLEKEKSAYPARKVYAFISIAASVVLLAGLYLFFFQGSEPDDTYSDPEIAYSETIRILYSVSSRMNTGIDALDPLTKIENNASESMNKLVRSTNLIGNNLKPLQYFDKAMTIVASPLEIGKNK